MNSEAELQLKSENQDSYEELIIGIENGQGILTPLIAVCDDMRLREILIQRYEEELAPDFRLYRVRLNQEEPSLRLGVATLIQNEEYLQEKKPAVIMVTGSETLMFVSPKRDERTEVDKFMGYLQWGREGLIRFPYPIVLWVTKKIELEITRSALDFWSWRKGVVHFVQEMLPEIPRENNVFAEQTVTFKNSEEDTDHFLPLEDLKELIAKVETKNRNDPKLGTFYSRLGRLYRRRLRQGESEDDKQEKEEAFLSFRKAIQLQSQYILKSDLVYTFRYLGYLYEDFSQYQEAIKYYQKSLKLAREIGDRDNESEDLNSLGNICQILGQYDKSIEYYQKSLDIIGKFGYERNKAQISGNLGAVFYNLGQYLKAIEYYQKSLEIKQKLFDFRGEAGALGNLALAYYDLGQYNKAIKLYEQQLSIWRKLGDLRGEAVLLGNLGLVYYSLKQYDKAIEYHYRNLTIIRKLHDRRVEAKSLGNLGNIYRSVGKFQKAIEFHEQSLAIAKEIGDTAWEGGTLCNLGAVYQELGQYKKANEYYTSALQILHRINHHRFEANTLFNLGLSLAKSGRKWDAKEAIQNARKLYQDMNIEYEVKKCDDALYNLNQMVIANPTFVPPFGEVLPFPENPEEAVLPRSHRFARKRKKRKSWYQKVLQAFWLRFLRLWQRLRRMLKS